MVTYHALYQSKSGVRVMVRAVNRSQVPKVKVLRVAGGLKKFRRISVKATRKEVIIMAKSAKNKGKGKTDIVDEELDELEDLEDLDDLEDEELEDEEPEDEEDEDEDEEDESNDLDDLTVKELRARAKEDGHPASAIKGLKKDDLIELIEEGVEDEEEDEDEDLEEEEDDEEEEPTPKRKGKKTSKTKASRSRTTDGKVGSQEVAAAAGIDARKLRILLRKLKIERDDETGRYEWSSLNHPEVKKILREVKGGAADRAAREGLEALKNRKGSKTRAGKKNTGAKRKRSRS